MPTDAPTTQPVDYDAGELVADRFEITGLLGKGGFGETYAARDRDGKAVAIKVLQLHRLQDWKALELFEREARVLEGLDHPGIPNYVDFLHDEPSGRSFLVQELAPGQSIAALLADGRRFKEADALEIARQVLHVLVYLESLRPQVVHRDIKPDNLLWDERSVYLVDFGAVREVARQVGEGSTVAGTFGYMAPEQLMGRASPASDLFGLGMTLIHMVTGVSPERLEQRRGKPDFRPQAPISGWFADLLDSMVEVVVEDRVDSARRCLELIQARGGPTATELAAQEQEAQRQAQELARLQESLGEAIQVLDASHDAFKLRIKAPTQRLELINPRYRVSRALFAIFFFIVPALLLATLALFFTPWAPIFGEYYVLWGFAVMSLALVYIGCLFIPLTVWNEKDHHPIWTRAVQLELKGNHLFAQQGYKRTSVPRDWVTVYLRGTSDPSKLAYLSVQLAEQISYEATHLTREELREVEDFLTQRGVHVEER